MSEKNGTQINVAQLLKSPVGTTREYEIEAMIPGLDDGAQLIEPVVGRVALTRINGGVWARGHLKAKVEISCDRCLGLFSLPVEFDLDEQFVPVVDVNTGKWLNIEELEPELLIDDHHILNLDEVFRQSITLELPMHPVCRPDCPGLCPHCGRNLDEGPCDCTAEEIDPRWESLRGLMKG